MTKRQRWLTAALGITVAGLFKLGSVITGDGTDNAPQAADQDTLRAAYGRCVSSMPRSLADTACDLIVFGESIEEDDPQGRWLCDLMGNRTCTYPTDSGTGLTVAQHRLGLVILRLAE